MKKIFTVIAMAVVLSAIAVGLCACGSTSEPTPAETIAPAVIESVEEPEATPAA